MALVPRRIAAAALEHYGLGGARLRPLALDTNWVYRVDLPGGGRAVLRVQRPGLHSAASTELELWWVQRLAAAGVPVAGVIPTVDGALHAGVTVDGADQPVQCVLFEWVPGRAADEQRPSFWPALGELAARLHDHAAGLKVPARFPHRRWDSMFPYEDVVMFGRTSPVTSAQRRVLRDGIAALDPVLHERAHGGGPVHLVHGDLHDGNVRVRPGGGLTAFDFEDHLFGHPEHDLAVALYGPYYNRTDLPQLVAGMRTGYERVRPWPVAGDGVSDLAPLFVARALGMVNFCVQMGPEYHSYIALLTNRVRRFLRTAT